MTKTNQMITIHLFTGPADTEGVAVQATVGQTLMAAAVDANVDGIAADCGGTLTCATCHVINLPVVDWPLDQPPAAADAPQGEHV